MNTKTPKPQRTCTGCRKRFDQTDLLAVTKQKDGSVHVNPNHKLAGRSAYICKKPECFLKAKGKKGKHPMEYWLKTKIPENVWAELEKIISHA